MRAKVSISGFVSNLPNTVMLTQTALALAVSDLRSTLQAQHKFAYDVGGHQLHGGFAWTALSPNTVRLKRQGGYPRPNAPLYRTGAMQRNQRVTVNLRVVPEGVRYTITAWNNKLYSGPHQTGFRNVWTGTFVPKRPPATITETDLDFVAHTLRGYMRPDIDLGRFRWR